MQYTGALKDFDFYRVAAFRWREHLSVIEKIFLSFVFACLTGVAAQVRLHLPMTPVPITGQVFAVLLSAVLLGRTYGGLSQVFYVGLGIAGFPWFAGGMTGSVLSPTTGYLAGFILAAFFIGWATDRTSMYRRFWTQAVIMTQGILIIYLAGAFYFSMLMKTDISRTLSMAVYPFIILDLLKAYVVCIISGIILPISDSYKY